MMIKSFAQNFEDVILWRALGHVRQGCYIDIGAWEPEIDSVSKAFYDLGWRGIHVEPVPHYAEKLKQARPDEQVIEAAVALGEGRVEINIVHETGLSTGRGKLAQRHKKLPYAQSKIKVPKIKLSVLFELMAGKDIHWLKIDVEGMEKEVLQSWQAHAARPWVLVIESCEPNSQKQTHQEWQSLVQARGYRFVYFDGLNRFYVHRHHKELERHFGPGPNVFDAFFLSPKHWLLHGSLSGNGWKVEEGAVARHDPELSATLALSQKHREDLEEELAAKRIPLDDLSASLSQAEARALEQQARIGLLSAENRALGEALKLAQAELEEFKQSICSKAKRALRARFK